MLQQILLVIVTAVITGMITVIVTLVTARKPIIESVKEAIRDAMNQHEKISHQKVVPPHISEYIDRQVQASINQHISACRAPDFEDNLEEVFKRLGKLERVVVALFLQNGGKMEDIDKVM